MTVSTLPQRLQRLNVPQRLPRHLACPPLAEMGGAVTSVLTQRLGEEENPQRRLHRAAALSTLLQALEVAELPQRLPRRWPILP